MKSLRQAFCLFSAGLLVMLAGCAGIPPESEPIDHGFRFQEITKESGIDFIHEKDTFDEKLARINPWFASTGAGVAVADYDRDGFMDLYFVNSKRGSKNVLYRNLGDGTFQEVAEQAGVANTNQEGIAQAAVWLDADNDGYSDLFVGKWGESQLFHNNGNGTFTEVTEKAGVGYQGYVNKAITLDYNRDGLLDLYLGCYFRETDNLWNSATTKVLYDDFERARNGGRNVLYRNNGDGTFTNVAKETGVDDPGWTLATGSADINNDGWPDLYNANDFGPDMLYLNEKGKQFKPVVQKRGVGDDTFKGMNVDFADLFHDGKLAFFVSNISKPTYLLEGNQLWHENEQGQYVDRAQELGVIHSGFTWGGKFLDVDNSGNFSLAIANGFISANPDKDYWFDMGILATTPGNVVEDTKNWTPFEDKSMSGYEPKSLFLNQAGKMRDVAQEVGITFRDDARGVAAVDLKNEGVLDLVYANQGAPARVYKNIHTNQHNWIKLDLVGRVPSNRDAVGARVTFTIDGVKTVMEKDGGNSHGAQSDPRLHLGMGKATRVSSISIRWPSGRVQVLENVAANQILRIEEPDTAVPTR